jgi:hypothetical protein
MERLSALSLVAMMACSGGAGSAKTGGDTPSTGSAGGDSKAAPGCPQEPGGDAMDAPEKAYALGANTLTGCIGGSDTRDVFALPTTEPGGFTYYIIEIKSAKRVILTTYDQERRVSEERSSQTGKWWVQVANGTAAYFAINRSGAATKYTLKLSSKVVDRDVEPNNTVDKATALTLGAERTAMMSPSINGNQDVDVYGFELAKPGKIKVELYPGLPGASWKIRLLAADGSPLFESSSQAGRELVHIPATAQGAGKYFLEVRTDKPLPRFGGTAHIPVFAREPYRLTVSLP